jgi:hypothetical protein
MFNPCRPSNHTHLKNHQKKIKADCGDGFLLTTLLSHFFNMQSKFSY